MKKSEYEARSFSGERSSMIAFHLMLLRRAAQQDCLVPREGGTFAEGCGSAAQQECVVTREVGHLREVTSAVRVYV